MLRILRSKKGNGLVLVLLVLSSFVVVSSVVLVNSKQYHELTIKEQMEQQAEYIAQSVLNTMVTTLETDTNKRKDFLNLFIKDMVYGQSKSFIINGLDDVVDEQKITINYLGMNQIELVSSTMIIQEQLDIKKSVSALVNFTLPTVSSSALPSGDYCMMIINYPFNNPVDLTCNSAIYINNDVNDTIHKENINITGNYNIYLNGKLNLKSTGSSSYFNINLPDKKIYINGAIDADMNANRTSFNINDAVIYNKEVSLKSGNSKANTLASSNTICDLILSKDTSSKNKSNAEIACSTNPTIEPFPNKDVTPSIFPSVFIDQLVKSNSLNNSDLILNKEFTTIALNRFNTVNKDIQVMLTSTTDTITFKEKSANGVNGINNYYFYIDEKVKTVNINADFKLENVYLLANHKVTINISKGDINMFIYAPEGKINMTGGKLNNSFVIKDVIKTGGEMNITKYFNLNNTTNILNSSPGTLSLIEYRK